MPDGYYDDVRKILIELGYRKIGNAKGSHEKWRASTSQKTLIVPYNLMSRHTANAILKTAGHSGKL